jgi:hypothetical protein
MDMVLVAMELTSGKTACMYVVAGTSLSSPRSPCQSRGVSELRR